MEGSLPASGVTASALPTQHPVELCLDNLKDEVLNVLRNEASYKDTIQRLETELSVYKRAYADVDLELKAAQLAQLETETINRRLEQECQSFKKQDKGHRIVMLLDGDGAIFSPQFIGQGQKGGHAAAQLLSDATLQYIAANYDSRALQLWVYVFFNKRGLVDALRRAGFAALIGKFEDFVLGFNQATERFLMVDVGSTKEAADAKLKVYLEDEIRLPETFKIIFGGCHDNGYVANLHSQITAGFKDKLILLRSYTEMAGGIAALGLPTLTIPDLFMPHKIEDIPSSPTSTNGFNPPLSGKVNLGVDTPPPVTPRLLNPNVAIQKQKPMLCTLYYMKSCKFGAGCKFAHDYVLTDAQREDLAKFTKKTPCPTALSGGQCKFGTGCCYGHVCPYVPNCFFLKQGKCKFKQANMHTTPASSSG
ncbi:hypothetical protein MVEN_01561300 [Mycena venus]|uniref:C3H1-type domain-containing protein n=1 Tax=Mycena venus TaxID=2733690 RepID=A0A8H7CS41_9AGAR|nr:hypothetical protein MVEN_01561300 [Mycena venus]